MTTFPGRARRTDLNQSAIVAELRQLPGLSVIRANAEFDLVVGYRGRTYLFEVKRPDRRSPSRIRPAQKELASTWTGHYQIVSTTAEILQAIGYDLAA